MGKRKLIIDFDGVITNATKKIVELYDTDFCRYKNYNPIHWTNINTYGFEELTLINRDIVLDYFDDHRFFINLEYNENAKEVLDELKDEYEIIICSIGRKRNLYFKHEWIKKNLPYTNFIGVGLSKGDKSCIDMSDCLVMLDDNIDMLHSTNIKHKVIYGDVLAWNANNIYNYPRCFNWYEFKNYLEGLQ